jgi:methionine-rich copper-binding protein CopC
MVLAAVALVAAASAVPASAHAVLVRSTPPSRAELHHAPGRVELWFSEALEPAWSSVSVWSAAGVRVDRQDAVVGPDPKRLSVTLPAIEAGTYTVRFRVLSVDAHVVEASFPFTLKPRR